jgi:hypothetical protein
VRGKDYRPGDWLKQSAERHLQHADEHVAAITSKTFPELGREDVSHAICRFADAMGASGEE